MPWQLAGWNMRRLQQGETGIHDEAGEGEFDSDTLLLH